jgi:hypothetical protein
MTAMPDRGAPLPPMRKPRVPIADVIGRPTDDVLDLYRADGFQVQAIDLDTNPVMTADLRFGRIRLFVRDGRVVRASQG